jgi:transposase
VFERANMKLAAVASDIMGVSARALLDAFIAGRADPATMAALAQGRLRSKLPALEQALRGVVRAHHQRLLAIQLAHIDCLDEQIEALRTEITPGVADLDSGDTPVALAGGSAAAPAPPSATSGLTFTRATTLLDTIPGVKQRGAEMLVAEWGIEMARFGSAGRLAAWSGVAPGNDASAGKQRAGTTRKGNRVWRAGLTQWAHAAVRTKETYLSAFYHRIAARRGKKRAIMAVAHSIVVSAFHMLTRNEPYRALGATYFDEKRREHTVDRLAQRIERLGYEVHLEPRPTTA